ncbi:MAG: hypothetical protein H6Q25_2 [Bacteroidetes bacterium]|nr:hypothetical protein [Bacteroidota bacterium]
MKNRSFLTTTLFLVVFTSIFVVKAQVPPGIVPASGIPVLVPATVNQLMVPNGYSYMSFGNSAIQRSLTNCDTLSLSDHINASLQGIIVTHNIITSSVPDQNTCNPLSPGQSLYTMPVIPFWDTLNYGIPRVMRLGNGDGISFSASSAAATYYFTPTNDQNILFLWVAFVIQSAQYQSKSDNGLFRVEMTDLNGNYVTGDYYTSTFYIIPETTSDPVLHPCCQTQYTRYSCPGVTTLKKEWADWRQLAFDLSSYIGQTVKLRIIVSDCACEAFYSYCYYTGFGVKGNLEVQSCALDTISIKAPVGFNNYKWYINNVYHPDYDSLQMINILKNKSDTLFRCEAIVESGSIIVLDTIINYYTITPGFTWQQMEEAGLYKVQFSNTSTLFNTTNNENVSQNINHVLWDFGDGTNSSDLNPIHNYSGVGPYTVTLRVFDNNNLCSEVYNDEILLSGVSINDASTSEITFNAYPNPFNEEIILEVQNSNEIVPFEISNLLGQVVYQGKINHKSKVRTQNFKPGVYIVKFLIGNQTFYTKLVKE